ncbi:ABC transporter ATP-binding protein [Geoglobus ahangari]
MIRLEKVTFSYNGSLILRNVDLVVGRGEVTFILGPNGSGKTTLLRCIAGILRPEGAVYVEELNVAKANPDEVARRVAYVPQRTEAPPLTVFDTILLGRKPHIRAGVSERDVRVVERVMGELGIEGLAARRLTELSGGELQKVAIARAMAQEPRVLLLDEPTNNLDIRSQHEVMKTVLRLVREREISAVITTHDLSIAGMYADRIVMVKDGRIHGVGGRELLTAETIGEVYGMEVEVHEVNGRVVVFPR